ncbi:MAG: LysR family transcriptional regulator [Sulfuritalea sp.]|nr:LysR family transcriptional regulator [Sulfuritalea sp.]
MPINLVEGMRVFAAVVEAGSFAGAAEKLDLSRGMTTRYVAQLEAHLGVRLLNRTTRKLSLTDAGGDYHRHVTQILAMVEEAESSAAQKSLVPRGVLRISTSVGLAMPHLGRMVNEYLQAHPEVAVEMTLNERVVDMVEEGFDLSIRIAAQIDPGLIARRLAGVRTIACAAPAYLKKYGTPDSPAQLAGHNCMTYAHANWQHEWRFRQNGIEQRVRISGNLRVNNGNILVNAAIDGLGVIVEPDFLVNEALRRKQLVPILADWETDSLSMFAVYPNRKYLPPKVRSFVDLLVERFGPGSHWPALGKQK